MTAPGPLKADETMDWYAVGVVVVAITVFATAQGMTYPLLSFLLDAAGLSQTQIGLNAAAFMAGLALSVLCVPVLSRAMSAGAIIVLGLLGSAVVLIAMAVAEGFLAWLVLRFFLGVCVNAIYVFGEAWLNAACEDRLRGRVVAAYSAGMSLGFVVGPLLIPVFGTENGLAFAACAALAAAAALVVALAAQRTRVQPTPTRLTHMRAFACAAPALVLLVALSGFIDASILAQLPVYLMSSGFNIAQASAFIAILHVGMILAQPLQGYMLDRISRWWATCICLTAACATLVVFLLAPVQDPSIWVIGFLTGAAYSGIYTCALALLGQDHHGPMLAAGASAFSLAYAFGGMFGPIVSGYAAASSGALFLLPLAVAAFLGAVGVAGHQMRGSCRPTP